MHILGCTCNGVAEHSTRPYKYSNSTCSTCCQECSHRMPYLTDLRILAHTHTSQLPLIAKLKRWQYCKAQATDLNRKQAV